MKLKVWTTLTFILTLVGIILCVLCLILYGDGEKGRYTLLGIGLVVAMIGIVLSYSFCRCPLCGAQLALLNKICPKCYCDIYAVDEKQTKVKGPKAPKGPKPPSNRLR